jgi:hypothetical protein
MARIIIRKKNDTSKKHKRGVTKKTKKNYNSWDTERMKSAIEEFKSQGENANLRMIARAWDVPKSTLQRRVKERIKGSDHCSGRKPVLSEDAETELAGMVKLLAARGFPLGQKEIRELAYQFSVSNNLNVFSKKHKKAGYYWFKGFMERHPDLRVRKPEALSAARAMGMNKVLVDKWFQEYDNLVTSLGIKEVPSHIWNCDETGLVDHFERRRAVGTVGEPCYQITANEKGETTTVLACFNAVGTYAPLLFVFKGSRLQAKWCVGSPASSLVGVSPNGWINSSLFAEWAAKFVSFLPTDSHPHVLLLDGHSSHVYNVEFLRLMKLHNVHIFCFPAHCSHWLQPADKSLFKSVKHFWNEEGWKRTKQSGGARLQRDEFFGLFSTVWSKSATIEIAQNGFRATGLFPVNAKAIPETAFEPSRTSDRPLDSGIPPAQTGPLDSGAPPAQTPPAQTGPLDSGTPPAQTGPLDSGTPPAQTGPLDSGTPPAQTPPPQTGPLDSGTSAQTPPAQTGPLDSGTPHPQMGSLNSGTPPVQMAFSSCATGSGPLNSGTPPPQTASSPYISFASLVQVPHRERNANARKRKAPPSYDLTSPEHLAFVTEKVTKKSCKTMRTKMASETVAEKKHRS